MSGYHAGYFRDSVATVEYGGKDLAAGAAQGNGVDMQESGGWDGVMFEAAIGIIGNGGTVDMRVVHSANSNFSGNVNVADADNASNIAAIVQMANTISNVVVAIDVFRPVNRYLKAILTAGTNNANVAIIARRYRNQGRTPMVLPNNAQYVSIRAS